MTLEDLSSIAFVIGSFATFLNVKRKPSSYLIWTVCNIYWLAVDILNKSFYRAGLDVINLASSIWGAYSWSKKD